MTSITQVGDLGAMDFRIIGALQVDGRASWRQIAGVLNASERTVARRGHELLQRRAVVVTAGTPRGEAMIVRARCSPGMARTAAARLARLPDCTSSYLLTGTDCFAEIFYPRERLASLMLDELGGTPGVIDVASAPIAHYYCGVNTWRPGLITATEAEALAPAQYPTAHTGDADLAPLTRAEQIILETLVADGRTSVDTLARLAGLTESTAGRRLDALRRNGRALIRAVVEPQLIGLPVEAILWIRTHPQHVDEVGEALTESRYIRYAAATMGTYQLIAHLVVPSMPALHATITQSTWSAKVVSCESSLIIAVPQRSGLARS